MPPRCGFIVAVDLAVSAVARTSCAICPLSRLEILGAYQTRTYPYRGYDSRIPFNVAKFFRIWRWIMGIMRGMRSLKRTFLGTPLNQ